ncbi:MAG: LacI family DNA-binding transcriptional regulator [Clostridia bacterium]|nr:LacI family DNA-binding transcriptional regulator [Clostridia bacterium]
MATIQDVAKMAGVSVATVSRVLNNSPSVVESTKEAVMDAIKRLNYQPNMLGRNLRRSETKMILVLLPNISNPFYSRIVKGIEDVGHKNGYNVMLCNTDSDAEREKIYIEMLKKKLSDGVIFMAPELNKEELSDIGRGYPVVQCCEYKEGADVSHVSIDNVEASYKAMKHLIGLGHRRIGMISCKNNFLSTKQREEGYKKALSEAGIDYDPELVQYGDYSFKSGLRTAKQMLSIKNKPTAIFSISDIMAIGVLRAVKDSGLRVPEDVAVVGFDNISFASMCDPRLTTVAQPKYDLGCTAMDLLIRQIKGEVKEPRDVFMEHELIIRESSIK